MSYKKLKEQCQKEGHAVMASMKANGDVFIYVNPEASSEEIARSMIILATNVASHIEGVR